MSAGTITLTNGSTAVTGVGTTFTTDLSVGDIVTATVGGTFYTLYVAARASNTALTLSDPFPGATTSGLSWVSVPQATLNRVTAGMVTQTALAVRRILQENANWQAFYQGAGDITVVLDDGTPNGRQVPGPSWAKMQTLLGNPLQLRGELPTDANLNNYGPTSANVGIWSKNTSTGATIANGFPEDAAVSMVEVFPANQFLGMQRVTVRGGKQYTRNLTGNWNAANPLWSDWYRSDVLVYQSAPLAATINLNDMTTAASYGRYYQNAGTLANNFPFETFAGTIEVYRGYAGRMQQSAVSIYGTTYERYMNSATTWSAWFATSIQAAMAPFTGNADTLLDDGDYPTAATATGLPDPSLWGASTGQDNCRLSVRTLRNNTSVTQEWTLHRGASNIDNGRKFTRSKYSSNPWTPWREILDTSSISTRYGIGGATTSVLSGLDWQQFDFVTGATYLISNNNFANTPAYLSLYPAGTGVFIRVLGANGSSRASLEITPDVTVDSNYRVYNTIVNGAKGSRTFFTRQVWTSTDVGTMAGTVAAGNDSRLNTVGGKTGGDVSGTLRLTAASPASTPAANTLTNGLQAKSMFINGVYTNIAFGFYPQVIQGQGTRGILQLEIPTLTYWSFEQDGRALSSGGWQTGSDIILKENVHNVPKALASVLSMDGVTWDYRLKKGQAHRTPGVGLIAQQVERFCPKGVSSFPGNVEFDDESTASDVKSLDVSGVSAAYHNEAIKALFGLVKLALDDPDAARAQIAAIEADAQELAVSLDDLQRDYVPTPPQEKPAENATPDTAAESDEVMVAEPATAGEENQQDTQP